MNRISKLLGVKYPIIQGGMIWCSGWKLASAVSNIGALGVIGSGSMTPDILKEHIIKCKNATDKPFGVNIPLIFNYAEEFIEIVIKEKVPIVITSAGNPAKYTNRLQENGIKVVHVVANLKSGRKSETVGVDAVVAEGFEAGGHNGKEETTTLVLIPLLSREINIPIIAAGGISCGKSMYATMSLGAEAVQIGSRFAVCEESSAHISFKEMIFESKDGDTDLSLKKLIAVRLLKNKFYDLVKTAEENGANQDELLKILGKGRSKLGMFDGDIENGELEIGQVAALIDKLQTASEIVLQIVDEFNRITIDKLD